MIPVILDLDGTIANCDHRLKLVKEKPKNYRKFEASIPSDEPYDDVILIVKAVLRELGESALVIVTGRSIDCLEATKDQLCKFNIQYDMLFMKEKGDYRPDYIYKEEILQKIIDIFGKKPFCVFEDRDRVVQMYRKNGVRCLQVKNGEY